MNIDIREYLRINPISVHEPTLSGNDMDCFLLFPEDGEKEEEGYMAKTQMVLFKHLVETMFGDVLVQNDAGEYVWNENHGDTENLFPNHVKKDEFDVRRLTFESSLDQLEQEVDSRSEGIISNKGILNYKGAVEIQSRKVDDDPYSDWRYEIGGIWCCSTSEVQFGKAMDVIGEFPLKHGHLNAKMETTTIPFAVLRGGGESMGDFTTGSQDMVSQKEIPSGRLALSNMVLNPEEELAQPLHGGNILDWRYPRKTHDNMPPSTNVFIRSCPSTSRDVGNINGCSSSHARKSAYGSREGEGEGDRQFAENVYESQMVKDLDAYVESDLTENDCLLRICPGKEGLTEQPKLFKQTLQNLLDILSTKFLSSFPDDEDPKKMMKQIVDGILQKKSDFMMWSRNVMNHMEDIGKKLDRYKDLLDATSPSTYAGRIVISTTDDTEAKIIAHYGGRRWRRLTNFLNGVDETDDDIGKRHGEEYVCLRESNIPPHVHGMERIEESSHVAESTMLAKGVGESPAIIQQTSSGGQGIEVVTDVIGCQIGELNNGNPTHRYATPHSNMPPYRQVYIWECVSMTDDHVARAKKYRITYDMAGHGTKPSNAWDFYMQPPDDSHMLPYAPNSPSNPNGYQFGGWTPAEIPCDSRGMFTFHASWNLIEYSISYDLNGHDVINPNAGKTTYTIEDGGFTPQPLPDVLGYAFTGWQPASIPPGECGDMEFIAQWNAKTHTLTFMDGEETILTRQVTYGQEIGELPSLTQEGREFLGWYMDGTMEDAFVSEDMIFNRDEDVVCHAVWNDTQYHIVFDTNGGEGGSSTTMKFGQPIIVPPNPSRIGYAFSGWEPTPPATCPARDMTFYAQWNLNSYVVTFNPDGGTIVQGEHQISRKHGQQIGEFPQVQMMGHGLVHWIDSETGQVVDATTIVEKDLTCTSIWQTLTYRMVFDMNGGDGETISTMQEYGSVLQIPEDPSREGWLFTGWEPEPPERVPAQDTTFTATWKENPITITYDSNNKPPITITYDSNDGN